MRLTLIALLTLSVAWLGAADVIDLAGIWRLALDRDDQGIAQQWSTRTLEKTVPFPCSLAAQGIGDPVTLATSWTGANQRGGWYKDDRYAPYRQEGAIKLSYWLTPDTVWKAPAWFQRDLDIPAEWKGKRLVLSLERAHIATQAWLDGRALGSCDSLSTAHVYDLGTAVAPGRHVLTLRVDNRVHIDVGHDSHSISDHTQGNWNGVVGAATLTATTPVWIAQLRTEPERATKRITVRGVLGNTGAAAGQGTVTVTVTGPGITPAPVSVPVSWQAAGGTFTASVDCGTGARDWDEFDPVTYRVEAVLAGHAAADHRLATTCGFRDIAANGNRLTINGRPLFLRGTLECSIFPKTGHPPTDTAEWRRILGVARAHGLNHLRFHSWCPPAAAFQVADEMGFYCQIEAASWANDSTTLGDGKPVDAWIHAETRRILDAYGNHPSFVLMLYGNEPGGPTEYSHIG